MSLKNKKINRMLRTAEFEIHARDAAIRPSSFHFPLLTLRTILSLALGVFCLNGCTQGSTFIPPVYPVGPQTSVSPSELQIFIPGGFQPLQVLDGVSVGEKVSLEARGVPPGTVVAWYSSNVLRGNFFQPGELYLSNPGDFEVRVHAGPSNVTLPVHVGPRPDDSGESNAAENPIEATSSAIPSPSTASSDPFVDEVIAFHPGPFAGFGSEEFPQIVLGPPRGGGNFQAGTDVLSLGVGGEIILKSDSPILDGAGIDFIVFENPFFIGGNSQSPFVELAEVAVSQDGTSFIPFTCEAENRRDLYPGCAGVEPVLANSETNDLDPTNPEEAGGDGFDLEDLGLSWIQYIRLRDLSESGAGNSAGFDLDAIAIVHQ